MMTEYRNWNPLLLMIMILALGMAGCISLAEDITPPPDHPTFPPPTEVEEESSGEEDVLQDTPELSNQDSGPTPQATVAETPGKVTVQIENQSENQSLEGDVQIRLEGFDHMNQVYQETLPVEDGSEVTFDEVPFTPGRLFFASVSYRGAVYRSDIVELEPEAEILDLTVEVFGTTTDQSGLQMERLHVFVDFPQEKVAQFAEIFIVSNFGQETVVSDEPDGIVLNYSLPPEAENLRFETGQIGERFILTEEGFGDTVSIPPGSGVYQLLVFYDIPYEKRTLQFNQTMNVPVGAVVVMTPTSGVSLKGEAFEDMGTREVQEGAIHVYAGERLDRGEDLTFTLSGKPGATAREDGPATFLSQQNLYLGLGVFGGVLLAVGMWFFVRMQREEALDLTFESERVDKEEIMDAIIALDDKFKEGEIAEEAYRTRRDELKSRLKDLVRGEESE